MDTASASTRKRRAIAAWIFVAVGMVQAIQAVADAIPKHALDPSWLDHARFHLTVGAANQLGFAISAILVALVPFRERGERWSWWVLLNFAVLSTVVLIPATLWQGSGPPAAAWLVIGVCIAAMLVALLMTLDIGLRSGARGHSR